jgi:hypothetical protein
LKESKPTGEETLKEVEQDNQQQSVEQTKKSEEDDDGE